MAKPFIIESEVIESMIKNPWPKRGEVADIENCIIEGADSVLLNMETSVGRNPAEACKAVSIAITEGEKVIDGTKKFDRVS